MRSYCLVHFPCQYEVKHLAVVVVQADTLHNSSELKIVTRYFPRRDWVTVLFSFSGYLTTGQTSNPCSLSSIPRPPSWLLVLQIEKNRDLSFKNNFGCDVGGSSSVRLASTCASKHLARSVFTPRFSILFTWLLFVLSPRSPPKATPSSKPNNKGKPTGVIFEINYLCTNPERLNRCALHKG